MTRMTKEDYDLLIPSLALSHRLSHNIPHKRMHTMRPGTDTEGVALGKNLGCAFVFSVFKNDRGGYAELWLKNS